MGGQFANMGELAAATQRLIAKTARAQAHTLVKTSHWKYLPAVGPTVHGARCTVHGARCTPSARRYQHRRKWCTAHGSAPADHSCIIVATKAQGAADSRVGLAWLGSQLQRRRRMAARRPLLSQDGRFPPHCHPHTHTHTHTGTHACTHARTCLVFPCPLPPCRPRMNACASTWAAG